jgi:hypothetical protein
MVSQASTSRAWALACLGFLGVWCRRRGLGFPSAVDAGGGVAHLVGRSGDDAADRRDAGQRNTVLGAPRAEQHVELGLAEVRVERA